MKKQSAPPPPEIPEVLPVANGAGQRETPAPTEITAAPSIAAGGNGAAPVETSVQTEITARPSLSASPRPKLAPEEDGDITGRPAPSAAPRRRELVRADDDDHEDDLAGKRLVQPPYIGALATYALQTERFYRVYILRDELLFIEAGLDGARGLAVMGWMFGGIIGYAIGRMAEEDRKRQTRARQDQIDRADLEELFWMAENQSRNFRAAADDVISATLEPASFWQFLSGSGQGCQGILNIVHAKHGKLHLEIPKREDVRMAMDKLPPILGERLTLHVEWDKQKHRFVRT